MSKTWDVGESLDSSAQAARVGGHVPVLDGVRGVAIVLVMLQHMTVLPFTSLGGKPWLDVWLGRVGYAGWAGVDLFFVLSGFLITGILLDSKEQRAGTYFRNFYARRVLRIFPLYYLMLTVALLLLPRLAASSQQLAAASGESKWYYWAYLSNVQFALRSQMANPVLGVTWSLAVEEHFYLVWPLIVFLLPRRALGWACGVAIAGAMASRMTMHAMGCNPIAMYVLTFCRMDGLAIGALLALVARSPGAWPVVARWGSRLVWPLAAASLVLIVWGKPAWGQMRCQMVGYTLFSITSAALIARALSAKPGSLLQRSLQTRLMVAFGKYSYALYLIHLPLRAALRDRIFNPDRHPLFGSIVPAQILFYILGISVSLAVAFASYHLFEKHFLKLKALFPSGSKRIAREQTEPAPAEIAIAAATR